MLAGHACRRVFSGGFSAGETIEIDLNSVDKQLGYETSNGKYMPGEEALFGEVFLLFAHCVPNFIL